MPKSRPPYPEELRREAVGLARSGRPIKDVAGLLGVTEQSLRNWVIRDQLVRRARDDALTSEEREELRRLRRENARLKQSGSSSSEPRPPSRGRPRPGDCVPDDRGGEAEGFPVSVTCRLLGVSRSGYYDWASRAQSGRALQDAWLIEWIKKIWPESRRVYVVPRIHTERRLRYGIRVGGKRVQCPMRHVGISGLISRKRRRTKIRMPGVMVADDPVRRQFRPDDPDVLWIADISYLRNWEGWLHFAAVRDAFSPRRIVGWSAADHMRH
jgi:putative transposase